MPQSYGNSRPTQYPSLGKQNPEPLDTLAHEVTKVGGKESLNGHSDSYKSFRNRQIAKAITSKKMGKLIDLQSPLKNAYFRTLKCNEVLLQDGEKVSAKYCKNRFCVVCNRIRTAQMINGYLSVIDGLCDLHLVTLTVPAVYGRNLALTYLGMVDAFRRIRRNIKKNYAGFDVIGFRAFECNYKSEKNTFNPHFHLLVEGYGNAVLVKQLWLGQYPNASSKAQDVKKANSNALIELVKYVAKGVVKGQFYEVAMDTIYMAVRKKKVFETYGVKKVKCNMSNTITTKIDFKGDFVDVWKWDPNLMDWINSSGEAFMGKTFDAETYQYLNEIK